MLKMIWKPLKRHVEDALKFRDTAFRALRNKIVGKEVTENEVTENEVTENEVTENEVTENEVPDNEVPDNEDDRDGSKEDNETKQKRNVSFFERNAIEFLAKGILFRSGTGRLSCVCFRKVDGWILFI